MKNKRPYKDLPIERLRMLNSLHHGPFGDATQRRLLANEFRTRMSRDERLRKLRAAGFFVGLSAAEAGR